MLSWLSPGSRFIFNIKTWEWHRSSELTLRENIKHISQNAEWLPQSNKPLQSSVIKCLLLCFLSGGSGWNNFSSVNKQWDNAQNRPYYNSVECSVEIISNRQNTCCLHRGCFNAPRFFNSGFTPCYCILCAPHNLPTCNESGEPAFSVIKGPLMKPWGRCWHTELSSTGW